jgi:hypothetical protein
MAARSSDGIRVTMLLRSGGIEPGSSPKIRYNSSDHQAEPDLKSNSQNPIRAMRWICARRRSVRFFPSSPTRPSLLCQSEATREG